MKFTLSFKTPDVTDQIPFGDFDDQDELDKNIEFVHKYLRYGEIIEVEFDTEAKTVRVLEQQ